MAKQNKQVVVITGAAGNIGRHLTSKLSRKYRVIGLDLPDACEGRDDMIGGDITSAESMASAIKELQEILNGDEVASVIHLAAYFDFTGKERPSTRP